ncbi:MAG: helix-turn-helix transcriptional regulator [Acidobacteria bacterium]|nr:helix-turn-helix transcriptional regulator [Acidobacteriota bacterium]
MLGPEQYRVFLAELRAARERKGITQVDLAARLGETQSFVSKCERGERRLNIVEVRAFCQALEIVFPTFAKNLDRVLPSAVERNVGRKRT